jgi:4-alpha-glucanotransferase
MNLPGRAAGNWNWRMHPEALDERIIQRLKETNFLYARCEIEAPAAELPEDYPLG